jgi:hypothetical protein
MKVYVFPADQTGCGYYRLIWPAEQLKKEGHSVHVVPPTARDQMLQARLTGDQVTSVQLPADADVVVFQRVTHRVLVQAIPVIRASGVAVVIDMDDDLTCIHPANPAFHMLHPHDGPLALHSWQNTLGACDAATLVTVSTPALAQRYARRTPGRVLYNMVPARYLEVPHNDSEIVGWAGSVHSHPTDLQVMGPAVAKLLQGGNKFRIVGPLQGVHSALGIGYEKEIESTGVIKEIEAWPLGVASLGIGVAPLADSKFNASKSWLKVAEYAAVGVPFIASPRAEYDRFHRLGAGLLAKNSNEWSSRLRDMINSETMRKDLSEAGRAVMREKTIEGNAWRWMEAWQEAYDLQQKQD